MESSEIEAMVEALVDKRVTEIKRSMVPHICFTCKHFIMRKEKPRNRVCRCPTPLETRGNLCLSWELEPDPQKRINSIV